MHVLIDESRLQLLQRLAKQRGTSISTLVREAIDRTFEDDESERARRRREAGDRLLSAATPPGPPIDVVAAIKRARDERADRLDA